MPSHLTCAERDRIARLRILGFNQGDIARTIGRRPSTMSRELRRSSPQSDAACYGRWCERRIGRRSMKAPGLAWRANGRRNRSPAARGNSTKRDDRIKPCRRNRSTRGSSRTSIAQPGGRDCAAAANAVALDGFDLGHPVAASAKHRVQPRLGRHADSFLLETLTQLQSEFACPPQFNPAHALVG